MTNKPTTPSSSAHKGPSAKDAVKKHCPFPGYAELIHKAHIVARGCTEAEARADLKLQMKKMCDMSKIITPCAKGCTRTVGTHIHPAISDPAPTVTIIQTPRSNECKDGGYEIIYDGYVACSCDCGCEE